MLTMTYTIRSLCLRGSTFSGIAQQIIIGLGVSQCYNNRFSLVHKDNQKDKWYMNRVDEFCVILWGAANVDTWPKCPIKAFCREKIATWKDCCLFLFKRTHEFRPWRITWRVMSRESQIVGFKLADCAYRNNTRVTKTCYAIAVVGYIIDLYIRSKFRKCDCLLLCANLLLTLTKF